MSKENCCLVLFLLVASLCLPTDARCLDETDCSARCNPEHWRRQLCAFYAELRDWKSTTVRCGLPDPPDIVWDQTQSSEAQWQDARSQWLALREVWRQTALEETSSYSEGSASGMFGLLDDGVDDVETVSEGVSGDLLELWRGEQSDWSAELQTWKTLVGDTGSEGAEPPIDPLDRWSENLSNWADEFATYNTTFYELCTL